MKYYLRDMKCSRCGKVKRMSIELNETTRHTYCIKCNTGVIWEATTEPHKMEEDND